MELETMLQMQKALDERIIKEKGLEGQDLTLNTVNALVVELSEFANEGRWFKHWKSDKSPRTKLECEVCSGSGHDVFSVEDECFKCHGLGSIEGKNPLLEEYVDSTHFFLSLANQKRWQKSLYIYEDAIDEIRYEGFQGGLTGAFLEINYWLLKAFLETDRDEKLERALGITKQEFHFKNAWFLFLAIGLIEFDFTFEQIAQAYCDKNKVNHRRQDMGY